MEMYSNVSHFNSLLSGGVEDKKTQNKTEQCPKPEKVDLNGYGSWLRPPDHKAPFTRPQGSVRQTTRLASKLQALVYDSFPSRS